MRGSHIACTAFPHEFFDQFGPRHPAGLNGGSAARAQPDQPGASIGRIHRQLDPPALLQVRHRLGGGLLSDLHPGGQLPDSAVGADQVLEDQPVAESHAVEPAVGESFRDLVGGRPPGEQRQQRHVQLADIDSGVQDFVFSHPFTKPWLCI